jgi:hypothetical protein
MEAAEPLKQAIENAIAKLQAVSHRLDLDPAYRREHPEEQQEVDMEALRTAVDRLDHYTQVVSGPLATLESTLETLRSAAERLDTDPEYVSFPRSRDEDSDLLIEAVRISDTGLPIIRNPRGDAQMKIARPENGVRGIIAVERTVRGLASFPSDITNVMFAVSSFVMLDEEKNPIAGVHYNSNFSGNMLFRGVTSESGEGDFLPYGSLMMGWDLVYGQSMLSPEDRSDEQARLWSSHRYVLCKGLLVSDAIKARVDELCGARFGYELQTNLSPLRSYSVHVHDPEEGLPPIPGRTYYHKSVHPEAGCSDYRMSCERWCKFDAEREAEQAERDAFFLPLAAKKIQRAVRHWLYSPGTGAGFRNAMSRFEAAAASASASSA